MSSGSPERLHDRRDPVPAGVAIVLLKGPSFEAAPNAGSLIVVAAMALFAAVVPVRTDLTVDQIQL